MENKKKRTIDYTSFDFDEIRDEMVQNLVETNTFKDIDFESSNIRNLVDLFSYLGANFGYYVNSAANEVFVPTAKRYKNLNKIGQLINYNPKGKTSSTLNVVASVNPEYVYGKEGEYIEIPTYSIFPSNKRTINGENFIFTNESPIVYIIRGYGIRNLDSSDIVYKGFSLSGGITRNPDFFTLKDGSVGIDPEEIVIPLSLYKKLSIIKDDDYRSFDTDEVPLKDFSSSDTNGQPFNKNLRCLGHINKLIPEQVYYLRFNFEVNKSEPYLSIVEESNVDFSDKNMICSFILTSTDHTNTFYTLKTLDILSLRRFYIGNIGMRGMENIKLRTSEIENRPNSVSQIHLDINNRGFSVLINGEIYNFSSTTISSNKFPPNFWDVSVESYNVKLVLTDKNNPANNYGAKLEISQDPDTENSTTIAKINTNFIDPISNTRTLQTPRGKSFGDFRSVSSPQIKGTEQRAGQVYFQQGETSKRIIFSREFDLEEDEELEYHISLTSEANIRKWAANKTERGFILHIEPETQFEGFVQWIANKTIKEMSTSTPIVFDRRLNKNLVLDDEYVNYMVLLTPSENVEVWYENLTESGFDIKTERDFTGSVSWSVINFFDNQQTLTEEMSPYRQTGTALVTEEGATVRLDIEMPSNYAIQLIGNKNVTVWYEDKTSNGFTIKIEPGTEKEVLVDWYVDHQSNYQNQFHGEVTFSGQETFDSKIPGLRFIDLRESFVIDNLKQGSPTFTYINSNNIIDPENNGLEMSLDVTRVFEEDLKFIVNNKDIAINSIRVFVKNEFGNWDEWTSYGIDSKLSLDAGNKVYKISVNPEKKITIEFGDSINWGKKINDTEVFIIGSESVGVEGNIVKNTLNDKLIISRYMIGNENTNLEFENNLIGLIGLKSSLYFQDNTAITSLLDSENTRLRNDDVLINQYRNAVGGREVEEVDEIRQNVVNNFISQDRNVSLNDYRRFVDEHFYNYVMKTRTLSFNEVVNSGVLSEDEIENYWYNHIFMITLNKDGTNIIPKVLRNEIIDKLENSIHKMSNTKFEILPAKWVPIDISIRYKKMETGSYDTIENNMRKNIKNYFHESNHEMGSILRHSDIINTLKVENVESIEVYVNKNRDENINPNDYNPIVHTDNDNEKKAVRNKMMEMISKDSSLIKIFQPMFETIKDDGVSNWNFSLDVRLKEDEFPRLGNIIIKREG